MTTTTALPPELANHLDEIRVLCDRYGIRALYVFGSAVHGTFDPTSSDLDFLLDAGERGVDFLLRIGNFSYDLERLVGRRIDLLLSDAPRNARFMDEVRSTRVLLHAS
ncbi:MAG TPA: nucleotidyltransferase domain-containing protein [Thermomicrobiales bacterium]|jgi:hypothetical protein|nr:nucleotidyltransferase domain-containing protein [Thermomicrobiales bacterium]